MKLEFFSELCEPLRPPYATAMHEQRALGIKKTKTAENHATMVHISNCLEQFIQI